MSESRSENSPAVALRGVRKVFRGHLGIGRTVAVDDLDLTVRRGEIFGLLGPNGAGKTTTIKLMLGLLRPDRGEVRLLERSIGERRSRSRIGFLPEHPYFYDYLTAGEFLDFYGRLQGLPGRLRRERVAETLARVGLSGRADIPLRKFSKGMVQRVGLAQAIQHGPELVVLDEPLSGLDPVGRREVRDLILALRDEGRTVFFSSHILQDAELVCDRVAILDGGKLRWSGELRGVVDTEPAEFEIGLRGRVPDSWPGERIATSGDATLLRVEGVEALERVLVAAREAGVHVRSVWPRRETLEDLFLRELGRVPDGTRARG